MDIDKPGCNHLTPGIDLLPPARPNLPDLFNTSGIDSDIRRKWIAPLAIDDVSAANH
jgi:hypothetical protein